MRNARSRIWSWRSTIYFAICALLSCSSTIAEGGTPGLYQIIEMGLSGPEYTRASDGARPSSISDLNDAGMVSGESERFFGSVSRGYSAWLYDGVSTREIGLPDAEHTRSDGSRSIHPSHLNNVGQVAGQADRYAGGYQILGQSTWLFDGATTRNISPTGSEFTSAGGYRTSSLAGLNEAGQANGSANRYAGNNSSGTSVWFFDGSITRTIGLTGSEHTRADGYQSSSLNYRAPALNGAGHVIGYSKRYSGSDELGESAWLFDGSTTREIGLIDGEHTHAEGHRYSLPSGFNEAGQVIGVSERYGGENYLGTSAWIYKNSTTQRIGLIGGEHTRSDGIQDNRPEAINASGQVLGYAARFGGGFDRGRSVWLYDGNTTRNIGLTGTEHTRGDGYQYSGVLEDERELNQAGQVVGYAERYNGGSKPMGRSAWLYDGLTTRNVGLTDSEHTRADGYRYSDFQDYDETLPELNPAGQIIGYSNRYNSGDVDLGVSTWLYDEGVTQRIGLIGTDHTRADGYQFSKVNELNDVGQAIGYSRRYSGTDSLGVDSWVYDPVLGTVPLSLSISEYGHATSIATYLDNSGLVLGYYEAFDEFNYLGTRAFSWTAEDGLWDLGSLVEGGLTENGWSFLAIAVRANDSGYIVGDGLLLGAPFRFNHARTAFLLKPVPEPSAIVMASFGAVGLMGYRWRARRTPT